MSKLPEIKQNLQKMNELSTKMRAQLEGFKGPQGVEFRKQAKEAGTRMGIGAGIGLFGIATIGVASIYIIALIILLIGIALPLWAAALIVVPSSMLFGAGVAAIGFAIASKAAKSFPKLGGGMIEQLKEAGDEMKAAAQELQTVTKEEAEERQKQMKEMMEQAVKVAPIVIGAYVGYRIVKKAVRARRARKRIILEEWLEA